MQAEKKQEFDELCKQVMKWMAENLHPHTTVIIESTRYELMEGICSSGKTLEFIPD